MVKKSSFEEREKALREKLERVTLSEENNLLTIRVRGYKREFSQVAGKNIFIPGEIYSDRNKRLYLYLGFGRTPSSATGFAPWFLTELNENNELIFLDNLSEKILSRNMESVNAGN